MTSVKTKAVVFIKDEKPSLTYAGGNPALSSSEDWPLHNGEPLNFLCQIDLSTVPDIGMELPHKGLLQFYTAQDDLLGMSENPGSDFEGGIHPLVTFIPDASAAKEVKPPRPIDHKSSHTPLIKPEKKTFFRPEVKIMEDMEDATNDEWEFYLGGVPFFAQQDFREDVNLSLELLLGWTGTETAMWGDGGAAGYWITSEELSDKDFSQTSLYWDCY